MVEGVSQLSKTSFIETPSFVRLQQTLSLQNFSPLLSQGKRWERRDGKINDNQFKETMTISVKGKRPLDERTGKPLPKETNLVDFLARDEQLQQLVRIGMQTGAVNLTDIQNLLNEGFRMPSLSAGGEDPQKILFQKPLDARKKAEVIALVIKKVGDNNVAQRGRYIQEITNAMNAQIDRVGPHAGIALDQADYITALAVGGGDALIMAAHEADYAPYAFSQTDPSRRKVVDTVFHPTGTQHAREFSPSTEDTGKSLFAEKKRRRTFDSMKKAQQMLNREQDVLADLAGAQLLFNDMLPPDVIIEMGLLNLQIQREPDLVKREDLRHELVKKRQKAYIAILQANGVKGFAPTIQKSPNSTTAHTQEASQIEWLMENGHLTEQDVVDIQGYYKFENGNVAHAKDGTIAYEKMGLAGRIRKRMKGLDRSTSVLEMNRLAMTDMLAANCEVIGNRKLNVTDTIASTIQSFDISTRHIEELKKDPDIASLPDTAKNARAYEKLWEQLQEQLHTNGIRLKKSKSQDTHHIVKSFIQDRVRTELKLKENRPQKADSHFASNVETISFGEVEDQALKGIDLLYRRTISEQPGPKYHGTEDETYRKKLDGIATRLNNAIQMSEKKPNTPPPPKTEEKPEVQETREELIDLSAKTETKTETEVPKEIQDKIDQIVADRIKIAEKTPQRLQLVGESGDSELDRLTRYFVKGTISVKDENGAYTKETIPQTVEGVLQLAQQPNKFLRTFSRHEVPRDETEAREILTDYLAYHAVRKVVEEEVAPGVKPKERTDAQKQEIRKKMDELKDVKMELENQLVQSLEKIAGKKPQKETQEPKNKEYTSGLTFLDEIKNEVVTVRGHSTYVDIGTITDQGKLEILMDAHAYIGSANGTNPSRVFNSGTVHIDSLSQEVRTRGAMFIGSHTNASLDIGDMNTGDRDTLASFYPHGTDQNNVISYKDGATPNTQYTADRSFILDQILPTPTETSPKEIQVPGTSPSGKKGVATFRLIEQEKEGNKTQKYVLWEGKILETPQTQQKTKPPAIQSVSSPSIEFAATLTTPPRETNLPNEFIHIPKEVFDYLRDEVLTEQTKIQPHSQYYHLHDELTEVMQDFAQLENAFGTDTHVPNSAEAEIKVRNTIRTTIKILNEVNPSTYIPIGKINLTDGDRFVVISQGKLQILRTHRLGATALFRDVEPGQISSIQVFDELRATEQWNAIKSLFETKTSQPTSPQPTQAPSVTPTGAQVQTVTPPQAEVSPTTPSESGLHPDFQTALNDFNAKGKKESVTFSVGGVYYSIQERTGHWMKWDQENNEWTLTEPIMQEPKPEAPVITPTPEPTASFPTPEPTLISTPKIIAQPVETLPPIQTTPQPTQPQPSVSTPVATPPTTQTASATISPPTKQPTSSFFPGLLGRIEKPSVPKEGSVDFEKPLIPQLKEIMNTQGELHMNGNVPVLRAIVKSLFSELLGTTITDDNFQELNIQGNKAKIKGKFPGKFKVLFKEVTISDIDTEIELLYENGKLQFASPPALKHSGKIENAAIGAGVKAFGLDRKDFDITKRLIKVMKDEGIGVTSLELKIEDSVVSLDMKK